MLSRTAHLFSKAFRNMCAGSCEEAMAGHLVVKVGSGMSLLFFRPSSNGAEIDT